MSQNHLNNAAASSHRDYGATSSTSAAGIMAGGSSNSAASLPDVNFSGFSPTEFMSLNEDIGHNIQTINFHSKQLDKILKVLGTPREQQKTRSKVDDILKVASSRIEATSVDLQRLTAIVRRGDKQQKLQLEKLTTDFCTVVERYTAIQKSIVAAMSQPPAHLTYQQDENGADTDRDELLQKQRRMEQMQFSHDMLVDRARQIREIEANIVDVNAIMHKLSTTVHMQGQEIDLIENHIESAAADVEAGRQELAKAANSRQSYRRKILILLAIAVIIGLIVTGIIVSKLSS